MASVLASWLDNDDDGCADTPEVLAKLLEKFNHYGMEVQPAILAPGIEGLEEENLDAAYYGGYVANAVLYPREVLPSCSGPSATGNCVDASLEEIWHVITDMGYAKVFPSVFSPYSDSESLLTQAMDVARGGKFITVPDQYPSDAWYTYYDHTCDYSCMATEYIYWGVNAWVGALVGRGDQIHQEWRFETREKLEAGDVLMTALIKDTSTYKLPNVSPTGDYNGPPLCGNGPNHS